MRVLLAIAVLAAAMGAGCGSDEEGDVRATVDDLYTGFAERDSTKVCDSLTKAQREKFTRGASTPSGKPQSCERAVGVALSFVGDALKGAGKAEITKVEVDGQKASATVKFRGKSGNLGLAKEADAWKVSDFDLNRL